MGSLVDGGVELGGGGIVGGVMGGGVGFPPEDGGSVDGPGLLGGSEGGLSDEGLWCGLWL